MGDLATWIENLAVAWVGGLEQSGYWGIFVLMAIESSFLPLPSEIVMIPAGALAAEGKLSVTGSIIAGTAGSLAGALFNYYFALFLGRTFLLKFGKYMFLPREKFEWAEEQWRQHGEMSTFVARLLPVIRHLISLPAGLARMNLAKFCFWTTAGAAIWCTILTLTGYYLGDAAKELWYEHKELITIGLFGFGLFAVVAWLLFKRWRKTRIVPASADAPQ